MRRVPGIVLGLAGELILKARHDQLAVEGRQQDDDHHGADYRGNNPDPGYAGCHQGRQFLMPLDPGCRKHRGGQGQETGR